MDELRVGVHRIGDWTIVLVMMMVVHKQTVRDEYLEGMLDGFILHFRNLKCNKRIFENHLLNWSSSLHFWIKDFDSFTISYSLEIICPCYLFMCLFPVTSHPQ